MTNHVINRVTDRILRRSRVNRAGYLDRIGRAGKEPRERGPVHGRRPRTGLAYGSAAPAADGHDPRGTAGPRTAVVTSRNDTLSAHRPYAARPAQPEPAARRVIEITPHGGEHIPFTGPASGADARTDVPGNASGDVA